MDLRFRSDYYTLQDERPDNVWDFHLAAVVGSFGDWDWRPELSRVANPVLTIHGDYDGLPLDGAREWVASLPDAQLLIVPQAGHFPWAEEPEIVFPAIHGLLTGRWENGEHGLERLLDKPSERPVGVGLSIACTFPADRTGVSY